jgi:hypothetical protein
MSRRQGVLRRLATSAKSHERGYRPRTDISTHSLSVVGDLNDMPAPIDWFCIVEWLSHLRLPWYVFCFQIYVRVDSEAVHANRLHEQMCVTPSDVCALCHMWLSVCQASTRSFVLG